MEFNGIYTVHLLTGAQQEGLQAKLPQEKAREEGIAVVFRLKAAQDWRWPAAGLDRGNLLERL